MLPTFPNFRKVDVSDREVIEAFTHRFDPYSDFNFTSLWAWDTDQKRAVCTLRDNLAVRFTDYATGEPFYSFLGTNETEETARDLLRLASSEGIDTTLRLVPEVSTSGMRESVLHIREDRDNHDYVLDVPALARMKGNAFSVSRRNATRFAREHSDARFETVDLAHRDVQQQLISVIRHWEDGKKSAAKEYDLAHEEASMRRLFATAEHHTLLVGGVFENAVLLAFTIEELLPDSFSMGHFWKAHSTAPGLYDFLTQHTAHHLDALGVTRWNWEQDLGIEGLRRSKLKYRPTGFLKKFDVTLAT